MHSPPDMALWRGRLDPEAGGERWHQMVEPLDRRGSRGPGRVLLGICSDEGVTRNLGRPGARSGPDAIRGALGGIPWHLTGPCYDAGNLSCTGGDLEGLQEEQAEWVASLLDHGDFPLLLGGGHEIALGSFLGLKRHLGRRGEGGTIGIVNLDAHFDLRSAERSNSGTPFLQISQLQKEEGVPFRYFCLGVSETANTAALFRRAASLGAEWLLDEELTAWRLPAAEERVRRFVGGCDFIHLSIDLDVLPAAVAPGVSAPAARGVPLDIVEHLLVTIRKEAGVKLSLAELAEMNPACDSEGRTAKVAARLCHILTRE